MAHVDTPRVLKSPDAPPAASGVARYRVVEYDSSRDKGLKDLLVGLQRADMWLFLGIHDIRQRYRRSFLGPFWITIVLGVQVLGIGFLYAGLLQQDLSTFLPYLAAGLTVWAFISGLTLEGANVFINSAASIRSVVAPISVQLFRIITQHLLIFAHNVLLVFAVQLVYLNNPGLGVFLAIPGLALCAMNVGWVVLLLAAASARFRDIPLIVTSLITLMLIMTPVFWHPSMLGRSTLLVQLNPLFYLVEVARGPLIGAEVPLNTWAGLAIAAVLGWIVAGLVYDRVQGRVPFWV